MTRRSATTGVFLLLLLATAATPAFGKEAPAAAKEANAKGMALYRKKDYRGAAAEFAKAVTSYDGYVQARYNHACAAALLGDQSTARAEMLWINNRAQFDPIAKEKFAKAAHDPDLASLREDPQLDAELFTPVTTSDLLGSAQSDAVGAPVTSGRRAIQQMLANLPGKHDPRCDANDGKQGAILEAKVDIAGGDGPHQQTVRASLRDGVAVFDAHDSLVARSEPLGCFAARASGRPSPISGSTRMRQAVLCISFATAAVSMPTGQMRCLCSGYAARSSSLFYT